MYLVANTTRLVFWVSPQVLRFALLPPARSNRRKGVSTFTRPDETYCGICSRKGRRIEVAHVAPSPVVRLNWAVALRCVAGPEVAVLVEDEFIDSRFQVCAFPRADYRTMCWRIAMTTACVRSSTPNFWRMW